MSNAVIIVITVAVTVLLIAIVALLTYRKKPMTTKEIAFAAVAVGISFSLSYIKFLSLFAGGSVTAASLVPVLLFAYIYGFRKGLIVGMVYGWLQFVQQPFVVHPVQVLLDYVLGFGCIAFAGIFRRKKLPGAGMYDLLAGIAVAGIGRYICSVLSGVLFYAADAHDYGMPVLPYSLAYNSVLLADIAICIVVCIYLQYSRQFKHAILYFDYARFAPIKPIGEEDKSICEPTVESTNNVETPEQKGSLAESDIVSEKKEVPPQNNADKTISSGTKQ